MKVVFMILFPNYNIICEIVTELQCNDYLHSSMTSLLGVLKGIG